MSYVNITISGPGGTMSGEIYLIKKAFTNAGFEVLVNDKYPNEDIEETIKILDSLVACNEKIGGVIRVNVEHLPWGG